MQNSCQTIRFLALTVKALGACKVCWGVGVGWGWECEARVWGFETAIGAWPEQLCRVFSKPCPDNPGPTSAMRNGGRGLACCQALTAGPGLAVRRVMGLQAWCTDTLPGLPLVRSPFPCAHRKGSGKQRRRPQGRRASGRAASCWLGSVGGGNEAVELPKRLMTRTESFRNGGRRDVRPVERLLASGSEADTQACACSSLRHSGDLNSR